VRRCPARTSPKDATVPEQTSYRAVPAAVDLAAVDREILQLWQREGTFEQSLRARAGAPRWTFYEGPPTANGQPGTHHLEARVFKDVFPRYRTMKGWHVPRKAGWDCHGLPVEIAVERELGLRSKADIEAFGVAAFNARCRESVLRHVDAFEAMTERMGFWLDTSEAYRTMDRHYIDSVWWSLRQVWERGLLVEDHRVTPYCPRCETSLSDHELGQPGGYETVVDASVYVRLPLTSGPLAGQADLLVWTTTPWTLVSNTAVAAHPDVTYVLAKAADAADAADRPPVVLAEPLLTRVLGEGAEVLERFTGRDLEGWHYDRPFRLVDIPDAHLVVLATYVTTEDGTGLVHQAPAFGADDLAVARAYGLPLVNPVRADGTFAPNVPLVGGQFFKHADAALVADLAARGRLERHEPYEHAYPHCWRCHTPLLYYAKPSWYIRTTAMKDALLAENGATHWVPEHIQWGRYGDWLRNNVDWALSRSRYWGTPLPIWRNDADPSLIRCVGSIAELAELAGQDLSALDPHRPFVDDVTFTVPGVPGVFRRVPDVIDAWYDSGSMPFAQWGYPYLPGSTEAFESAYPAQFICEAIDQTRGWFYTLMTVGTLVFGRSAYEHVLVLGHILADDGRKMSKHLGNVLEPIPVMEEHGADAVRWFMAASGSPWLPRRFSNPVVGDIVRKVLLTYWNTAAFLSLYGRVSGWSPAAADAAPAVAERPVLDRWVLSELHRLVGEVDAAYEAFDSARVGTLLASFADDLSNWYVRRSRRRFWDGDVAALATLHECLETTTRLMAPLAPFVTERVWQDLVRHTVPGAPTSVHLADFPVPDPTLVQPQLAEQVALARRVVELGRAARAASGVRTRQPLARALVGARGWDALPADLTAEVADELNVQRLEGLSGSAAALVDVSLKGNFRALGRRFGKDTPRVAAAVAQLTGDAAAAFVADLRTGAASVQVEGLGQVSLGEDDVVVTETPREGWAVARDGDTVALDLEVTDELRRLGLAREVVRAVQEARKQRGFEVTDRVTVTWRADGETATALREHAAQVAAEVLAVQLAEASENGAEEHGTPQQEDAVEHHVAELGLRFRLQRV
jgi:isoleucyl-tRNA synthetase